MINWIVTQAMRQRALVMLATLILIGVGLWSAVHLPVDAVPDITHVQVQVNTPVPALAPEEIENLVTFPIETEMAGLPGMTDLRSLSKYGLSQVTMVFEDGADIYLLRQLVAERLQSVKEEIPEGLSPQLAPIATGLGEIFYYAVHYTDEAEDLPESPKERLMALKIIHDLTVKPLLRATPGITEINTTGGYEKQIVIQPYPERLTAVGMTLEDVAEKISMNTENVGGGLIELGGEQVVIRGNNRVATIDEIKKLPLKFGAGVEPLLVEDVAEIEIGHSFRTGAATHRGKEAVVGTAVMLLGENSRTVSVAVADRVNEIQEKLPEGVIIETLYNRSNLVDATIHTVEKNLFEGAIFVVVVLLLMLGNIRAAIIVAFAIPLSMLFAFTGMVTNDISGNLMSLGAIDFGLIIDGAVVMVENIVRHLAEKQKALGRKLTAKERFEEVLISSREVANPMFFGVLIITVVYVPILALTGIEGKMFRPMALTVMFALIGALILALTLMPVLCSYFLKGEIKEKDSRLVTFFKFLYQPILQFALRARWIVAITMFGLFAFSLVLFSRMGAEFVPELDEGDITIQFIRSISAGLDASLDLQLKSEKLLLEKFPEVEDVFARIGTSEVAMDPMGPNLADTFIMLKPRKEWRKVDGRLITKQQLANLMRDELALHVPGQGYLVTQPIQMRFNEIMAGARANLLLKIFGEDFDELEKLAGEARTIITSIPGASQVEFDNVGRNPTLEISPDREAMRKFNVQADEINAVIRAALAGEETGMMIDGNRRYEIVVRLPESTRTDIKAIKRLPLRTEDGGLVTLGQLANIEVVQQVGTIAREATQRRVSILINNEGRDTESFVEEAQLALREQMKWPDGYYFEFGGQFENLIKAKQRLTIVVPVAMGLIFVLIFMSFGSFRQAALIFTCVPLAITGGIFAIYLRGMPFTISAGVGFIALSGIAVLNGIMLISFINQLREGGMGLREAVVEGSLTRLRPKLMTALVASFGFIPMAIATGPGAEVQRPLATVVIGGIITSTILTLVLLPTLYEWLEKNPERRKLAEREDDEPAEIADPVAAT
ncbi:MAG: CusA/CzcA family heavy metal efflux RND transporter [Verrucomicrobiales bacterium]|nr:CusA/CzcA family heavy metal efflux RND transporter [Verrucomicrobiales bacterium]